MASSLVRKKRLNKAVQENLTGFVQNRPIARYGITETFYYGSHAEASSNTD